MTPTRYVSVEAAAMLLGTTPAALRHHLRAGHVAGVKLGRAWRVDLWALGKEGEDGRLDGGSAVPWRRDGVRDAAADVAKK